MLKQRLLGREPEKGQGLSGSFPSGLGFPGASARGLWRHHLLPG